MVYGLERIKYFLPLGVFVIVLILLSCSLYILNQQLLPISLRQVIVLDKPAVLHVWSSDCEACLVDHRFLTKVVITDEFQLVGVNYKDLQKNADQWLQLHGNPYRVTFSDADGSLSMALKLNGTPTTLLVDTKGIIRFRHVGVLTNEVWQTSIRPALDQLIR